MRYKEAFPSQVLDGRRGGNEVDKLARYIDTFRGMTGYTPKEFFAACAEYIPKFLTSEHARLRDRDRTRGIGAGARHELSIWDRVGVVLVATKKDQQTASAVFQISPSAVSKIVARHGEDIAKVMEQVVKRIIVAGAAAEAAAEAGQSAQAKKAGARRSAQAKAGDSEAGQSAQMEAELEEEREWARRNPTLAPFYPGGEASVDFTDFDTYRPVDKDDRKEWYSRKKRHAGKTLIVTNRWGCVGGWTGRFPGSHNDQGLAPVCLPHALLARLRRSFADGSFRAHAARAGYNMLTPFPNPRKGKLDGRKKAFNKWQRGRRAIVENAIPDFKRYNSIMRTRCGDHEGFNRKFRLVCSLVNFRRAVRRFGILGRQVPERKLKPCPVPEWTVKRPRVFHHGTAKSRPYSARPPIA